MQILILLIKYELKSKRANIKKHGTAMETCAIIFREAEHIKPLSNHKTNTLKAKCWFFKYFSCNVQFLFLGPSSVDMYMSTMNRLNNACGGRCQNRGSCRPSGMCRCPNGFTGRFCEQTCRQGTYGRNCGGRCQCAQGSTCLPESGLCFCPGSSTSWVFVSFDFYFVLYSSFR